MDTDVIIDITNRGIMVALTLASPMLLGALLIGILVSIFQAVTQINEQTLSFIPKIVVIVGTLVILGPWMMDVITTFTRELLIDIPKIIAGK
jgi:flagellar biosynthesis protein FliQ